MFPGENVAIYRGRTGLKIFCKIAERQVCGWEGPKCNSYSCNYHPADNTRETFACYQTGYRKFETKVQIIF